jgi:putative flippase GtrA
MINIRKALLFIFSGGTAALTTLVLFYVFLNIFHFWYLFASILSFILSVGVGFYLQKTLTFDDSANKKDIKRQAFIFFGISMVNLLVNILLMLLFVGALSFHSKMLAKILTLGIIALWNYFIYQKFVFNKKNSVEV